ncbi:hypothetical protein H2198_004242 [Neophaeococcomyces mojaviensis]|uniref:Uncharacterized protein n=1 Tax=Neophaeococcomyces mojaviensis TaxID=3383035 RepID=A0ACC3A9M0_9EURO|nr:hypothetical protein H2198_004242 [Knufia sp. JES_112]
MSAVLSSRNSEGPSGQASLRNSPAPISPRTGHKRQRDGQSVPIAHGHGGFQTPIPLSGDNRTRKTRFASDASLVLVGIRGSGKRSLGFIAAAALGRRFITEDHYFQGLTGFSRQEYLRIHGSEEFYKQDVEASQRMLDDNKEGCVIDCGLGSLTRGLQEHLKVYCQTNPVIYIQRDMNSVRKLLKLSDRSAQMLENGDPSHRRCSNYEFYNIEDESGIDVDNDDDRASPSYSFKLREAQADFSHFVRVLTAAGDVAGDIVAAFSRNAPIETKLYTHTLVMPLSFYENHRLNFDALQAGGDVADLHIDKWQDGTAKLVTRMVADVRRHLKIPIMVSTPPITNYFPLDVYFAVLRHALRLAVEFLVINLALERGWISGLAAQRGSTRFIGYIRCPQGPEIASRENEVIEKCDKAVSLGISLVKITCPATAHDDSSYLQRLIHTLQARYSGKLRFIAYNTGIHGRTSQVFNPILTPVTHENFRGLGLNHDLLPWITAREALQALFASFVLEPLHFFVFGANVSSSLSPVMHNKAYSVIGLPHHYSAVSVESWEDIETRARALDFGGASIAQPWKVKIMDKLSFLSDHARAIGAINTLVPLRGESAETSQLGKQAAFRNRAGPVSSFYGDNSDWISIRVTLNRNLTPRNVIHSKSSALIIGAGGMARAACYALLQMGCRNIFVYNRTTSNAVILADNFIRWCQNEGHIPSARIVVLESTDDIWPEGFAPPTIIISCVTHERLPGEHHVADFTVPEQWLGSETGGAAIEQAYYITTPFIQQIKQLRTSTGRPWVVVDGLEVLHEQAVAQFEMMTGRIPPQQAMWSELQSAVERRGGKV